MNRDNWLNDALSQHERPLMRYATRLLGGDVETARDVVQDTFLRLCRTPSTEIDGHLRQWLFTVCRNRAFDSRRRGGQMVSFDEATATADPTGLQGTDETVERAEQGRRLVDELRRLPLRQQEVLRLKFQERMSYREIASITGDSISNVGYLLHNALKTLRGRWGVTPMAARRQA